MGMVTGLRVSDAVMMMTQFIIVLDLLDNRL